MKSHMTLSSASARENEVKMNLTIQILNYFLDILEFGFGIRINVSNQPILNQSIDESPNKTNILNLFV